MALVSCGDKAECITCDDRGWMRAWWRGLEGGTADVGVLHRDQVLNCGEATGWSTRMRAQLQLCTCREDTRAKSDLVQMLFWCQHEVSDLQAAGGRAAHSPWSSEEPLHTANTQISTTEISLSLDLTWRHQWIIELFVNHIHLSDSVIDVWMVTKAKRPVRHSW